MRALKDHKRTRFMFLTTASLGIVEIRTGAMYYFLAADRYLDLVLIPSISGVYQRAVSRKGFGLQAIFYIADFLRQNKFYREHITSESAETESRSFGAENVF